MIYLDFLFKNYEEFKEMFGIQEHGNGTKSRRNKILLQMFKSREVLRQIARPEIRCWDSYNVCNGQGEIQRRKTWAAMLRYPYGVDFSYICSMSDLRNAVLRMLSKGGYRNSLQIDGIYGVSSSLYDSDDFHGICEDGDFRSVRYVNVERERVFKMKAGKFLRKIIEEHANVDMLLPEQVKIWICEDFAESWKAHAMNAIGRDEYTLYVNDNFRAIYDSDRCVGDFGSCMVNDGYWTFYRDSVDASAAYLENKEGDIVARCVIYNKVKDGNGKVLRLAERQYASDCDESLKRMLVMRLIEGGYIDGYKRVGADCHSPKAFVDIHGNPLENYRLRIDCDLCNYDTVSYQDSFKWYDYEEGVAYNYGDGEEVLATTDGSIEADHSNDYYSEWNGEYIEADDAVYIDTRDDYFYYNQTVEARVYRHNRGCYVRERCFEDDCIAICGEYYYAGNNAEEPEEYGMCYCPKCGDYFVGDDGCHSDITEEDYCCESCKESAEEDWYNDNGWTYSEYDGEWFEDEDDVISVLHWRFLWDGGCRNYVWRYHVETISVESFNSLVEDGEATEYCGKYYIDDILYDGEPVHLAHAERMAA